MKKILFVIGDLDVGGAERHLVQILPKLACQDFSLMVYTLTHKGKLAPILEDHEIGVIEPPFAAYFRGLPFWLRRLLLIPLTAVTLCILLARYRPAITHFFLPESYLLGSFCSFFAGRGIRIMSRRSLNRYQLKHTVLARVERWLHPRMNAVLGNSRSVVQELRQEGVPIDRLGLLYNGVDLTPFKTLPTRDSVRQSLGISQHALLMVCVANLIAYKGHVDLITALSEICAELPSDWVIAMVGRDSGMGYELDQLAKKQGVAEHILWLGERSDAIAIYSAAEIGILASHEEGFSNSVLEGMAAGVAMVVTDVGGNREAVIDGECGMVVPPRNPSAMGKAVLALADEADIRRRMGQAAHRRVVEKFSLDACVHQYASLYRALLRKPDSPVQQALDAAHLGVN